jgi:hypothetical protein
MKVRVGLSSEAKDLNSRIPTEYYQLLDILGEQMGDALIHDCTFDHAINLKDGTDPLWVRIHALSIVELKRLRKYLDK